jgi:hypothetical protein
MYIAKTRNSYTQCGALQLAMALNKDFHRCNFTKQVATQAVG